MSLPPQKMREVVFQLLFSLSIDAESPSAAVALIGKELAVSKKYVLQALTKVNAIRENMGVIDEQIRSVSESYTIERIQKVELNILRLGLYEIFFDNEIPPKVAISEAIRLAKKFSTPESASYINAVLDALYKKEEGKDVDLSRIQESAKTLEEMEELAKEASQTQIQTPDDEDSDLS